MKLTNRQKRFVDEYLIDLNATQAAIRSGYSAKTAKEIGAENLTKPNVANAIQQAMDERGSRVQVTQDDVIRDLCELRDICMGRKKITVTDTVKNAREGTIESQDTEAICFEPVAAARTLEMLGKHLKMFTEKVDHMSSDGSMTPKTWTPQQAAEELIKQAESLDDE